MTQIKRHGSARTTAAVCRAVALIVSDSNMLPAKANDGPTGRTGMPKNATQKIRDYRGRQRAQGLRPVRLWVPDTRDSRIRARIRRQVRALSRAAGDGIGDRLDAALKDIRGWTA
jgi:hypothetical protein